MATLADSLPTQRSHEKRGGKAEDEELGGGSLVRKMQNLKN